MFFPRWALNRFIPSILSHRPLNIYHLNSFLPTKTNLFPSISYYLNYSSSKSEKKDNSVDSIKTSLSNDRYIAVFTCNICNHRSAKSFSKQAYNHGIVYVRCESCKNLHLISDQLGWFGDKQNIEEILSKKGEEVSKMELGEDVSESDLELIQGLKDNKYFKE